ncbi:MAG: arginine decarboxylase [Rhodopirellula sp. TMED11]|nr:MAG: arginine decarboxylase [Rhodopirellula sp. TMED11]
MCAQIIRQGQTSADQRTNQASSASEQDLHSIDKPQPHSGWTIDDAAEEYGINRWGAPYFSISPEGSILVRPTQAGPEIDLNRLVDRLCDRGLELPILIRFNDILRDRLNALNQCFQQAIREERYDNRYQCVFPIKVNQQREVIQQVLDESRKLGFGVEAGSKPELLAAIAMSAPTLPIICNGFKDEEFIRLAMMAQKLGRTVFPVVEKASELDLIFRVAKEVGVRPRLGIRVKLATRGSGRWEASGGYRSKFGLTVAQVLHALDRMIAQGYADCFEILHFHLGSQISDIRQVKTAITEASRIYVDLKRRGAKMGYLDVGGGLGVDYTGTHSDSESSMNYSTQEYANDVVSHVKSVCDEAGVTHPVLMTETGRAVAAHHSVLVLDTLGVSQPGLPELPTWAKPAAAVSPAESTADASNLLPSGPPENYEQPVKTLWESYRNLTPANHMETFHDAEVALDMCIHLFGGGYLPLEQRVDAENLFFAVCQRVREIAKEKGDGTIPQELAHLDRMLSDIYFVNFSLFQSLPDAWAIDQIFPIMPTRRLTEEPTRNAVLGDITCDSDGKVDSFICGEGRNDTLRVHPLREQERYTLAVFLVGAYQEILGDLHNLFGDTHAVHVQCHDDALKICSIVKGDTVSEVLSYVQYEDRELLDRIGQNIEDAIDSERIDQQQAGRMAKAFEAALAGYTYLSPIVDRTPLESIKLD